MELLNQRKIEMKKTEITETKRKLRWSGLLMSVWVMGCTSNHVVYVQETSLGVNVGVGAQGAQKLTIGYGRDVFAIVPKTGVVVPEAGSVAGGKDDVMSLLAINKATVEGISDIRVSEFIATGEPAEDLAADANAVQNLRNKIYGSGE